MDKLNEQLTVTNENGKETFIEPSCEFVEFSFEEVLTSFSSNMLEEDYFI